VLNRRINQLALAFMSTFAMLAFGASDAYKVHVLSDSNIAGKQVKAGNYKVQVEGNSATLTHGKDSISVPAHVEEGQAKYAGTQIRYVDNSIKEIHIGGTTTKIVFDAGQPGSRSGGSN